MKQVIQQPHIPALDGLRGIAIILVILNHGIGIGLAHYSGVSSVIANLAGSTGYGVVLFFVLSGFLITGILVDSKNAARYFGNFYARRALRIFPLYYGVLFAFWVAARFHGFGGDAIFLRRLPWLLTYSSNILITIRHEWSFVFGSYSLGHFWSLAVEEQFYLIWPGIVLWLSSRSLKYVCLGAVALGYVSRVLLLYPANNLLGAIVFLPAQVDALAIGALLALLVRERERAVATVAWPLVLVSAAAWLASCVEMNLLVSGGMTAFAFMSAGLVAIALYSNAGSVVLRTWLLRQFGKYSYAIYVLHVIILAFVARYKVRLGTPLFVILFAAISFLAGWLSWHVYEVHFLRLKRFFPTGSALPWRPRSRSEIFAPAGNAASDL